MLYFPVSQLEKTFCNSNANMQFPSGSKHILSDQSSMEVVVSKLEIPLESNKKTRDEKYGMRKVLYYFVIIPKLKPIHW